MSRRFISDRGVFKLLVEPRGAVFAVMMRRYSYLFFLTHHFVGMKKIQTLDRVVARAGYSAPGTLALVRELYP